MIWSWILHWFVEIRNWFPWKQKQAFRQNQQYHVNNDFHFPGNDATAKGTRNKAYFDQHQKAPWNRKRKPNKHMRNLYKLSARLR